jgi:hypothetical protein
MPHVLSDAESVRAAAAIRFALALSTALQDIPDTVPLSREERARLAQLADRLAGEVTR